MLHFCPNALKKDMDPFLHLPAMGEMLENIGLFSLGMVTNLGEWKM